MKRWGRVSAAALLAIAGLVALRAGADTAPVTLKTTEFGRGPTVVLLHNVGSGRMVWMPTAKKLLANYHVVMVDLPGHGESALPDPFSLAACAEALDQVLARQKPDSTVLVAHRFGGLIALLEAQAHPGRVRGLMVIDAATRTPTKIPEQQQQYFISMLDDHYDEFLKGMSMSQGRDSLQGNELYSQAQAVPAASIKAYYKAALNVDASPALKQLRPMLMFVGSGQVWTEGTAWPGIQKAMGYEDATDMLSRRIPDCGPLIMKEQPDSLAAAIRDFTAQSLAAKKK
jgi:pimeloyl-ACP methyl ester carboxylesterase